MVKLQMKDFVLSTGKFKGIGMKGFLLILLFVVSVAWYLVTGSPLTVKIPVSVPITVSSQTSPITPGTPASEVIPKVEDSKIAQSKQAGNTAFTAKGVRHAIISKNIVEGFNRVAEVENIETLDMSGNLAMAPSKSSR